MRYVAASWIGPVGWGSKGRLAPVGSFGLRQLRIAGFEGRACAMAYMDLISCLHDLWVLRCCLDGAIQ